MRPRSFCPLVVEDSPVLAKGKMRCAFKQVRGIGFKRAPAGGRLTDKLSLNLGSDVNGDRHIDVLLKPNAILLGIRCQIAIAGENVLYQNVVIWSCYSARLIGLGKRRGGDFDRPRPWRPGVVSLKDGS
jgi:hypothetical protein